MLSQNPIVASMVVAEKRAGADGKMDVLATVMNIMSIRDIKSISMDVSLSELGMDSLMAVEIKQTLERDFEIFLSPQDLRSLTFQKLIDLSQSSEIDKVKLKVASEQPSGMELILRNLGREAESHHTILRLKSKDNNKNYSSCALIVPGIEGVAGVAWDVIATEIKLPTFIVQLTKTSGSTNIGDIIDGIIESVLEVLKGTDYFYLIGYSFGSLVTMELAKRLEDKGFNGKLLMIDGAPKFLKQLAADQLSQNYTDEIIQHAVLSNTIRLVLPEQNLSEKLAQIYEATGWENRMDKLIELSEDQELYSKAYLRLSLTTMFERLKVVMEWSDDDEMMLKCTILLVRPTEVAIIDMDNDYGLSKYSRSKVAVKYIEGNHMTMLDNMELTTIINEYDPKTDQNNEFSEYINSA